MPPHPQALHSFYGGSKVITHNNYTHAEGRAWGQGYCRGTVFVQSIYCRGTVSVWSSYCRVRSTYHRITVKAQCKYPRTTMWLYPASSVRLPYELLSSTSKAYIMWQLWHTKFSHAAMLKLTKPTYHISAKAVNKICSNCNTRYWTVLGRHVGQDAISTRWLDLAAVKQCVLLPQWYPVLLLCMHRLGRWVLVCSSNCKSTFEVYCKTTLEVLSRYCRSAEELL